jgi:hypothetical protein
MSESEMNLIITLGSTVLALIVGAVITWLVARHYYIQAGKELAEETSELRHLTTLVLRGMENADLAELNRDLSGKITGLILKSTATLSATASLSGKAEVIRAGSGDHAEAKTDDRVGLVNEDAIVDER